MKTLHTADWHFDDKDHDEVEKCVDFLIETAREERPDVIVVAGDITNSQNLKLDSRSAKTIARQFCELADIAPVAVIIGTPSHDGKSAEILRFVRGKHNIYVSERPEQIYLQGGHLVDYSDLDTNTLPEAIITQIPTPTKQYFQSESGIAGTDNEIAQGMAAIFGAFGATAGHLPGVPHILSGHFQIGGAFISETQQLVGRDIEISTDQIAMANAHVNCLGHIHMMQEMKNNTFYSGSIYRKNFGEMEEKGFFIHEIKCAELDECYLAESRFIKTPTRDLVKVVHDFVKKPLLDAVSVLEETLKLPTDITGAHVKIEIKVYQDEAGRINQAELERYFTEEQGAARAVINMVRIPRVNVRAEAVLKLDTLPDKVEEIGKLRLEEVAPSILKKATMLETMNADEIIQTVGGAL